MIRKATQEINPIGKIKKVERKSVTLKHLS